MSGEPDFFKRAFGNTPDEFEAILLRPHHHIFNRDWYERLGGEGEFAEFQRHFRKLSATDRAELVGLLSSSNPMHFKSLHKQTTNSFVKRMLPFYVPIAKDAETEIWRRQRELPSPAVVDEERVEDAGLDEFDDEPLAPVNASMGRKRRVAV